MPLTRCVRCRGKLEGVDLLDARAAAAAGRPGLCPGCLRTYPALPPSPTTAYTDSPAIEGRRP